MDHEDYRKNLTESKDTAFRMLFDEYCNYVYTIVFNRLRSCAEKEDMDECVVDIFADVFAGYNSEKQFSGELKGFIGTVAKRKAADYYKRIVSKKNKSISIDDENFSPIESGENIESTVAEKEVGRILLEKITELGEPDSTIIMQKYYYGRSSKEIADIVVLTPNAINVRCARAVKKLRDILEKSGITI